jgi:hemolysin III
MLNQKDRPQSLGEELANSVIHGLGLLGAIAALPFLIDAESHLGGPRMLGAAVFGMTMVLLYLTSTLYHALPTGRAKGIVLKLDHGAIYVFIAGTYTAFALGVSNGQVDGVLLASVWLIAIIGATLTAFDRLTHPWLSTSLYLIMGWLTLFAAVPIVKQVPVAGLAWLVAGGLAYTVGGNFFLLDSRLHYAHAVWHCFVAAGSGCHCIAVLDCAS